MPSTDRVTTELRLRVTDQELADVVGTVARCRHLRSAAHPVLPSLDEGTAYALALVQLGRQVLALLELQVDRERLGTTTAL